MNSDDFNILTDQNRPQLTCGKLGKADQSELYYTINEIEQSHMQALGDTTSKYLLRGLGDDSLI